MAKKTYKTVAETLFSNKMSEVVMPTDRVDYRRMSKDELKTYMTEAFKDAKSASDVEAEEEFWGDAELENELNWVKALKLKEYFKPIIENSGSGGYGGGGTYMGDDPEDRSYAVDLDEAASDDGDESEREEEKDLEDDDMGKRED